MNEVILQTLYFVASYIGIIIFLFWGINFLTKGWLSCYLKVKASRGKKIMVHVLSKTDTYYRAGSFAKGIFKFKTRGDGKTQDITELKREDFWYEGGVHHVIIEEQTGTIFPYCSGKGVHAGITPGAADEMVHRVITAPTQDDMFRKIIFISIIVMFLALCIVAFVLFDLREQIYSIKQISGVI